MGRVCAWCFFFVRAFRRKIFIRSRGGGGAVMGCRKSLGVCSYCLFLARNRVILQKNRKTEKHIRNSGRQKKVHVLNIEGSPEKSTWCITFFYPPLAKEKGVDWHVYPSPPAFVFIFCSDPTIGGMWPNIFTLLTMGVLPAWHLIQKNSLKTWLKDCAGTAAWSEDKNTKNTHPEANLIIFFCWGVSYLYHLANAWVTAKTNISFLKIVIHIRTKNTCHYLLIFIVLWSA